MFDPNQLETLAKNLYAALPDNLHQVEKEIKQQFKDVLQAAFARMDLVTREEFDVQTKVLARTREKVDALQAQLNEILKAKKPSK